MSSVAVSSAANTRSLLSIDVGHDHRGDVLAGHGDVARASAIG